MNEDSFKIINEITKILYENVILKEKIDKLQKDKKVVLNVSYLANIGVRAAAKISGQLNEPDRCDIAFTRAIIDEIENNIELTTNQKAFYELKNKYDNQLGNNHALMTILTIIADILNLEDKDPYTNNITEEVYSMKCRLDLLEENNNE